MRRLSFCKWVCFSVGFLLAGVFLSCGKANEPVNHPDPPVDTTDTTAPSPPDKDNTRYLFTSSIEGYNCYRIPAIIKTTKGTLLAFAEARKNNCSDAGDIDLVMRRSADNGKTWSEMQVIWDNGGNTGGNPVPIIDASNGRIILVMNSNLATDTYSKIVNGTSTDTRRVYAMHSDDDGQSWSTPKEITSMAKAPSWTWHSAGPCHGIQVKEGKYKGRLIVPCAMVEAGSKKSYAYVIFSDDHGLTWQMGQPFDKSGAGESTIAELSDGILMLNMRTNSGIRFVATSTDGGMTWENFSSHPLIDPACQGSLLSDQRSEGIYLFFANPLNSTARKNITIQMSRDEGKKWSASYTVHPGPAGYSDLVMLSNKQIGIVYEWGDGAGGYHERIAFAVIALTEFK